MQQKYKYLKQIDKALLDLIMQNSDLTQREYDILKSSLIKDNYIEKTCMDLAISASTYRNAKDNALGKVHLTFCSIIRNGLKD